MINHTEAHRDPTATYHLPLEPCARIDERLKPFKSLLLVPEERIRHVSHTFLELKLHTFKQAIALPSVTHHGADLSSIGHEEFVRRGRVAVRLDELLEVSLRRSAL